jgi:hypothetical protein
VGEGEARTGNLTGEGTQPAATERRKEEENGDPVAYMAKERKERRLASSRPRPRVQQRVPVRGMAENATAATVNRGSRGEEGHGRLL